VIDRSVIDSILTYGKIQYPKEGILLLRGKTSRNEIHVTEVVVPPLAVHGHGFSGFPFYMLPIDMSQLGTAHSHPSGVLRPSIGDLNHTYGILLVITAYPFDSEEQVAVYDREGNAVRYEIINEDSAAQERQD
jgi:proteasome lid subunit RPN8/RPN11